jgi:hypothetical protein
MFPKVDPHATQRRLPSPFYPRGHRLEWKALSVHREDGAMAHAGDDAYWRDLESHAHLSEVQEVIREEIRTRTIRVRPNPDGSIRIVPVRPAESGCRSDRT